MGKKTRQGKWGKRVGAKTNENIRHKEKKKSEKSDRKKWKDQEDLI